jgi:hypothetical protein
MSSECPQKSEQQTNSTVAWQASNAGNNMAVIAGKAGFRA